MQSRTPIEKGLGYGNVTSICHNPAFTFSRDMCWVVLFDLCNISCYALQQRNNCLLTSKHSGSSAKMGSVLSEVHHIPN